MSVQAELFPGERALKDAGNRHREGPRSLERLPDEPGCNCRPGARAVYPDLSEHCDLCRAVRVGPNGGTCDGCLRLFAQIELSYRIRHGEEP